MAKKVSKSTAPAVDTAKPKKIVFDDEGVPEGAGYLGAALEAGPSGTTSDQDDLMDDDDIEEGQDGDDDNDDDDDAPEAVGLAVGKQAARKEEQNAKALLKAEKEARAARSAAIRAKKTSNLGKSASEKSQKGKSKQVEETLVISEEEEDSEDGEDDDAMSFHTDSGDEDNLGDEESEEDGMEVLDDDEDEEDEDEDEEFSEEDEALMDPETRRLRARMQAAMEAAEKRAGGGEELSEEDEYDEDDGAPQAKPATAKGKGKKTTSLVEEDWSEYNMMPGVAPLSAAVLESARLADLKGKKAEKRKREDEGKLAEKNKKKKKARKEEDVTARRIDFRTTVAIAPPAPVSATSPSSVPRATIARKDIKATAQSGQSAFVRDAMKRSGKWDGEEGGNKKTKKGKKTESLIGPSNGRVPVHLALARGASRPAGQFRRQ